MKTFQNKQKPTFNHKADEKKGAKNPGLAERNEQRAARPTSRPLAKKMTKQTSSLDKTTEKKRKSLAKNCRKF